MSNRTQQFVKETILYGLGGAGVKVISFLLFPIYSRVFDVPDYGVIEVINALLLVASLLLTSGTDLAQSFYFYEKQDLDHRKKVVSTLGIYILIVNVFVAILVMIFAESLSMLLLNSKDFASLIRIASFVIPWMGMYTFILNLLRLQRKPLRYISITIPFLVLQLGLNILVVGIFQQGLEGIYLSNIFSYFAMCLLGFFLNKQYLSPKFDIPLFKEMFTYWKPLLPVGISAWFLVSADRLFLANSAGLEVTGIYSAGIRIASIVGFFIQAFRTANLPVIFEISKETDAKRIYQKTLSFHTYFFSLVVLLVSVFSKPLLLVLSGQEYLGAANIVPILAFTNMLGGTSQLVTTGALISKKTKNIGRITIVSALSMIVLLLILIPEINEIGAAISILVANSIYIILLYRNSQKAYPIDHDIGKIIRIFLATTGLITAKFLLPIQSPGQDLLQSVFLVILFFVITVALNLLSKDERNEIKNQMTVFINTQIFRGGNR